MKIVHSLVAKFPSKAGMILLCIDQVNAGISLVHGDVLEKYLWPPLRGSGLDLMSTSYPCPSICIAMLIYWQQLFNSYNAMAQQPKSVTLDIKIACQLPGLGHPLCGV